MYVNLNVFIFRVHVYSFIIINFTHSDIILISLIFVMNTSETFFVQQVSPIFLNNNSNYNIRATTIRSLRWILCRSDCCGCCAKQKTHHITSGRCFIYRMLEGTQGLVDLEFNIRAWL